jgi:Protein of unknown function (DUF2971)
MFYYRYRSPTEVSFKEFLYSELYFSSSEECNDPFDSKTYFVFSDDTEKWEKLLALSWKSFANLNLSLPIKEVAKHISDRCPLSFDEVFSENILLSIFDKKGLSENILRGLLSNAFHELLELYKPPTRYFVSFSEANDEPLMWSHYADKHSGFCLVFKAIDGQLKQFPPKLKRAFHFDTPRGLAPSTSYGIPESFAFSKIAYENQVIPKNAFNCFPEFVASKTIESEEDRLQFNSDMHQYYFQKHINWGYERESRLTLSPPTPWLLGVHLDYSPQQRLFHYEPTQLVGVIFGTRSSHQVKQRILDIIEIRQEWIAASTEHKRMIFDFVVFQAHLDKDQRSVGISPQKIYSLVKTLDLDSADFSERYKCWMEGCGLEFEGSRCSRVCIK